MPKFYMYRNNIILQDYSVVLREHECTKYSISNGPNCIFLGGFIRFSLIKPLLAICEVLQSKDGWNSDNNENGIYSG